MPPESLPWDHEYAFKDHRKRHRGPPGADALSGGGGTFSSAPRWRDTYYAPRDYPGPSPRRAPSGQYRQGCGYRPVYPEDANGHRFAPLPSDRLWSEDENFRLSSSGRYGGGGGGRSSGYRDGHGAFRRSPYWDSGDFSSRQNQEPHMTAQRSAPISSAIQTPLKDLNDKIGGGVDNDGLGTGHRFYRRDHSLGSASWKPSSKWSRHGSLGLTKTGRSVTKDSGSQVPVHGEKEIASKSLVTSPFPSDEDPPQKKPRLGWGQGLARYEKQKVEESADTSESGATGSLSDVSPKVAGLSVCLSPATPCSVNRNFSPGFAAAMEDKSDVKPLTNQEEKSYMSDLNGGFPDDAPIKYHHLESNHASALSSLLSGLAQPDDVCSRDSALSRHSILNKLLILKEDISKELEKTECVIDLFENELKILDCGTSDVSQQSKVAVLESPSEPHEQLSNTTSNFSHLGAQDVASKSCIDLLRVSLPCSNSGQQIDVETKCIDEVVLEPESTSSRCHQSLSSIVEVSDSIFQKFDECVISPEVENSKVLESQRSGSSDGCKESLLIAFKNANKDNAERASVRSDISLSANPPTSNIWELVKLSMCKENDLKVKEKLAVRRRLTKFKEKVLVLKFRALQFFWKEDLRLLVLRKNRSKSKKNLDLRSRVLQSGTQKQRSSIKSTRFSLLGNLTLVPNTEILDFTSKLLLNSEIKLFRNNLKMPALILDEKERMHARFVTHNGLIEDPSSLEREKTMINPWSQGEKEVFMELLATFGKDFSKISSYLQHKTTADCIEFYYKYHKSESFKEVKKRLDLRKTHQYPAACTYLVPSGKKWNTDVNVASIESSGKKWKLDANVDSLDLLGAASTLASHNHIAHNQQNNTKTMVNWDYSDCKMSDEPCNFVERENNIQLVGHVRESPNANTLAGALDASSSEIISPYVTGSPDCTEKINQSKTGTVFKTEVYESFDEDSCSDGGCCESNSTDWTDTEKSVFVRSLSICGKDFARIASCVGTRSREQCKIFYSKARKCLGLDKIYVDNGTRNIPTSDTNGGRSDTDDACTAEMDSAICSIDSCSKLEELPNPVNICGDSAHVLQTEAKQELVGNTSLDKTDTIDDKQVSIGPGDMQLDDQKNSQFNIVPSVRVASICVSTETQNDNAACDNHETKVRGSDLIVVPNETDKDELNQLNTSFIQHGYSSGSDLVAANGKVELKPTLPECALMNREKANLDFSRNSSSFRIAVDSDKNRIDMLQGNKIDSCPRTTFVPNYQHHVQLDLHHCLPKTAKNLSVTLENAHPSPLDAFQPDPSSISFGGSLNMPSQSTLNFERLGNRQLQNVTNKDFHQQFMIKTPAVDVDRHSHILGEAGTVSGNSNLLETHSNKNGNSNSTQFLLSDIHVNNKNSSKLVHSRSAMVCPLRSEKQLESEIQPYIQNTSSDTDAHRSCDVKLFGAVLSHSSSSLQNLSFSAHESICNPQLPVPRSSSLNPSTCSAYAFSCSKSSPTGPEEQPVRSYAFDGNIIQSGLSSLPESTVMLSKYHGSLAEGSPCNNGPVSDYQQSYMPQLSSDGKHLESCGEMQKKGGIEIISGFQQQVNLTGTGKNVVGRGVSTPVATLQLHCAARANQSATKLSHSGQR